MDFSKIPDFSDELIEQMVGIAQTAVDMAEEEKITVPEAMRKICQTVQATNRLMKKMKSPETLKFMGMKTEGKQ